MTGSNPPFDTLLCPYGTAAVAQAAAQILAGNPVAIPTETVYGLAANALSAESVARIYAAKGRPSFNPLIVHIPDIFSAEKLARFNDTARILAAHFWPGPLTMVLPKIADCPVASLATAGLETIALRCPAHPAMQAVLRAVNLPLAAPSANASGRISPTRAEHVLASLNGRISMILDAGPTSLGLESTIIAPAQDHIRLLRPGPITAEMLTDITGQPVLSAAGDMIEAPGQLASHYAPSKPVRLNAITANSGEYLIGFGDIRGDASLSTSGNLVEAAAKLFDLLHHADAAPANAIAIAPIPYDGLGIAINDRLSRAAV